jgi:hypothetical protein
VERRVKVTLKKAVYTINIVFLEIKGYSFKSKTKKEKRIIFSGIYGFV